MKKKKKLKNNKNRYVTNTKILIGQQNEDEKEKKSYTFIIILRKKKTIYCLKLKVTTKKRISYLGRFFFWNHKFSIFLTFIRKKFNIVIFSGCVTSIKNIKMQ